MITTIDENSKQEKVVMGRGIAFKKALGIILKKRK
ncbi:MAG: CAT RNA binding domain-containing protein [Clostridium sp.]|nr:CAT RNA binding domain-containing protein [Clostridium sp.]